MDTEQQVYKFQNEDNSVSAPGLSTGDFDSECGGELGGRGRRHTELRRIQLHLQPQKGVWILFEVHLGVCLISFSQQIEKF